MKAASLLALVALALGGACQPDNKVKPGAPVLMSLSILEASGTRTDITAATPDCLPGVAENGDCAPAAPACRLGATICYCAPKAMDDHCGLGGTWVCHFGPQLAVLATFDRLLDTSTLGPGNDGPQPTDVVKATSRPASPMPFAATANYNPDGSNIGVVFPAFGNPLGPSLLVSGDPALPVDANVTFTLDPTKIRAKDGKTQFTAEGLLVGGSLSFDTLSFGAGISVPVAPPPMPPPDAGTSDDAGGSPDGGAPDAAPDDAAATDAVADAGPVCPPPPPPPGPAPLPVPSPSTDPVTITFTNPIDMRLVQSHITLTANGTAIAPAALVFSPDINDPMMSPFTTTVTITPKKDTAWPASSTIVITVDASTPDVLGELLGAAATGSFDTTNLQ